jgi:hypothetical protein
MLPMLTRDEMMPETLAKARSRKAFLGIAPPERLISWDGSKPHLRTLPLSRAMVTTSGPIGNTEERTNGGSSRTYAPNRPNQIAINRGSSSAMTPHQGRRQFS